MKQIHEHATCRECPFEDRTDRARAEGEGHANETGHVVAYKTTLAGEIEPGAGS